MKKIIYILSITFFATTLSCKDSDFAERYPNPARISETTIEKQFSGLLYAANDYYVPRYRNYFVTLRTSINHYNQVTGWPNETGQYIPGSSGMEDVWNNYYSTLFQYRTLESVYNSLSSEEQASKKIYMLAGKIFMYDYTQRVVDLWGSIPFFEAGKIGINGGDYNASLPVFDSPESIYTTMLDDLKSVASELSSITLNSGIQTAFRAQDYVNAGNITLWKKYCNSLRLRMLTRVSGASAFSSRATSEIGEIVNNSSAFPIVTSNSENIFIDIFDVNSNIHSKDLDQTFGDLTWYLSTAGKKMMDFMSASSDPRLAYLFEPGANAAGKYLGMNTLGTSNEASAMLTNGTVAIYNRSTFQFNQYFPAVMPNAAEVDLYLAEYYFKAGNNAMAQAAYEKAVAESIDMFYNIQSRSANSTYKGAAPTTAQKTAYLAASGVSWTGSTDKLALIAYQKWLHYNLVQPYENWAENRRLDKLGLQFTVDNANSQTLPPVKWTIPGVEQTYNTVNYQAVKSTDNLNNKLFWDVN